MNIPKSHFVLLLAIVMVAWCSSGTGSDALSTRKAIGSDAEWDGVSCHSSGNPTLDPPVTNGSCAAGKHVAHAEPALAGEPKILCMQWESWFLRCIV